MMNLRNLGAGIVLLLIVLGGIWFVMISSYEEDLTKWIRKINAILEP